MTRREETAQFCTELGRALLGAPTGDEGAEREYVRLFLSPQGAPCPPWQSVWPEEGEEPRLLGAAHHSALEWYRRFGFEPATDGEPADHAGLLLLFYAHLLTSGAEQEVLDSFERAHLVWLRRFGEKLREAAREQLYASIGEELSDWPPALVAG